MTDHDETAEGFLQRWSRRKSEAERETPASADAASVQQDSPPAGTSAAPVPEAEPVAAFDLSKLPTLDSITATTDVRAFLMPGVPKELARAALRRAWAADPAIRDFVGLAENAWDFTDPNAVAGFGELPPGFDVRKLVAEIFGEQPQPRSAREGTPAELQPPDLIAEKTPSSSSPGVAADDRGRAAAVSDTAHQTAKASVDFVQCENNIAEQQSNSEANAEEIKKRRPHGGALPQ